MANAGGIRAGQAYVELTTDNAKLHAGLDQAAAKIKSTLGKGAADAGGTGSFLGPFESVLLRAAGSLIVLRHGLRAATAIAQVARGDWDGLADTLRQLPLVEQAEGFIRAAYGIRSVKDAAEDAKRELKELAEGFKQVAAVLEITEEAHFGALLASMAPLEKKLAEIDRKAHEAQEKIKANLSAPQSARDRASWAVEAQRRAEADALIGAETERRAKAGADRIAAMQSEYNRLVMGAREFAEWQAKAAGYSDVQVSKIGRLAELMEQAREESDRMAQAWREESERMAQAWRDMFSGAEADAREWYRGVQDSVDATDRLFEEGEQLRRQTLTPEEEAGEKSARYKKLLDAEAISPKTYARALAGLTPEAAPNLGSTGTFSGTAAGLMSGGGIDRIAAATERTAEGVRRLTDEVRGGGRFN